MSETPGGEVAEVAAPKEGWEARRKALLARARELPTEPGVYTFRGENSQPVYIGKATSLRARVSSYFRKGADDGRPLFPYIVTSTRSIHVLVTASPKEALLLENSLIKQQKPRFNVMLTDDKSYLSIKLTTNEAWPRLLLVRRTRKDKAAYFGPYASASEARDIARLVKRHFRLRTCSNIEFRQRTRPCLEHQMKRCDAPCVGLQSAEDYDSIVDDVHLFLKGRNQELLPRLEARMQDHSKNLEFELAARARDEIKAIRAVLEKRHVARAGVFRDQDAYGIARLGATTVIRVLHVRRGQVSDSTVKTFDTPLPLAETLNTFVFQFYDSGRPIPDEVLLPQEIEDAALIAEVLEERATHRLKVLVPQRGSRGSLVAMAMKNAAVVLESASARREALSKTLDALQDGLQLPRRPEVIECYDISTIQGKFTVASMVRFEEGEARRDKFRTYKITSVEGQDDFGSMREVLTRRFDPSKAQRLGRLPDLVVIDGGKGQLGVAHEVITGLVPAYREGRMGVVGLAKARVKKGTLERVFFPSLEAPVVLEQSSPELLLLARIRDEAHDHAIGYHRQLRRKRFLRSGLDEVPGVGPGRKKALLKRFGHLKGIREASLEELEATPGVPSRVAQAVYEFFHEGGGAIEV